MGIRFPIAFFLAFLASGAAIGAGSAAAVSISQADEEFVVDATIEAPVKLQTAWDVLTDFDNMSAILSNLISSKVIKREGNTLVVKQEGIAKYGLFSFSFQSEREINLEPLKRILVKQLSGTAKRMASDARLIQSNDGVRIIYHADIVPDSILARMFGAPFLRGEVEEQFQAMVVEMRRREANLKSNSSE